MLASPSVFPYDTLIESIGGQTITETSASTTRQLMSDAVLQNAPSLSNHNDVTSTESGYDLGQRLHNLNVSGYGSWPYIYAFMLCSR